MLWLGLALLTLVAAMTIVVPLVRVRKAAPPQRASFDRAIYRDQLTELRRDLERGVIDPEQAEAARVEIERRLLATEEPGASEPGEAGPVTLPVDGITAGAVAAAVSAGAIALYLVLGSPNLREPGPTARQNEQGPHAQSDLAANVDALAAKLKNNPADGEGWLLLARSQAALERWQDSAESYRRAIDLTHAPEASAGFGEMLVMAADGIVTPAARSVLATALAGDPGNTAARFYLALADAQDGKAREAIEAWTKLVAGAPPDAPWLGLVRQRIDETARVAGITPPAAAVAAPAAVAPPPASGPSASDVEAAQAMTPEERQTMIRGMVEKLAARLETAPDDIEGWQRLARAYAVLGETKKSQEAAARASALAAKRP
jgi:cytochrome c-type biogenesis protein CcmH